MVLDFNFYHTGNQENETDAKDNCQETHFLRKTSGQTKWWELHLIQHALWNISVQKGK